MIPTVEATAEAVQSTRYLHFTAQTCRGLLDNGQAQAGSRGVISLRAAIERRSKIRNRSLSALPGPSSATESVIAPFRDRSSTTILPASRP